MREIWIFFPEKSATIMTVNHYAKIQFAILVSFERRWKREKKIQPYNGKNSDKQTPEIKEGHVQLPPSAVSSCGRQV